MPKYAYKGTEVPVDRTMGKIKDMLYAHGAVEILVGEAPEHDTIQIMFARRFKFEDEVVKQPLMISVKFKGRKPAEAMRMLYYYLKAKFDAIDWGLVSMEEAFLPYFMGKLPDGSTGTVADMMLPHLKKGRLPPMEPFTAPQLTGGDYHD